MKTIFALFAIFLASTAWGTGDQPLPDFLSPSEDATSHVVSITYDNLKQSLPGQIQKDLAIALGRIHVDTPYLWGGDSWEDGVDCSHFTQKVFATANSDYQTYMQTSQLRDLLDGNGLRSIPPDQMQPGDLLVYGYYDENEQWNGHVVILVDPDFQAGGYQGMVLGSHGDVGVQFLTLAGFPDYFRKPHIVLRNVLRVLPTL